MNASDLLQFATELAKDYRDAVVRGSTEYISLTRPAQQPPLEGQAVMKMSGVFSTHLKAEELGPGKRITVTIERVEMEKVGDDQKPVMYFVGKQKGLALNKTNTNAITDLLGTDESDDWAGHRIVLYTTKVDYQGKRVLAIRVDEAPAVAAPVKPKPARAREAGDDDGEVTADEIGF